MKESTAPWAARCRCTSSLWWCVLGGGMGHAYGSVNGNIPANWREKLELPGARSLRHVRSLIESRPWWRLGPDTNNVVAVARRGPFAANDYAVTAVADDGTFALSYLPSARKLTLDLAKLKQPMMARWFDPTTGEFTAVEGAPLSQGGEREFTPPGPNSAGEGDWMLLLETDSPDGARLPVERPIAAQRPAAASRRSSASTMVGGLPRLRVSRNRRFLATEDGRPFFWLGDTALELLHRLDRAEAEFYLAGIFHARLEMRTARGVGRRRWPSSRCLPRAARRGRLAPPHEKSGLAIRPFWRKQDPSGFSDRL